MKCVGVCTQQAHSLTSGEQDLWARTSRQHFIIILLSDIYLHQKTAASRDLKSVQLATLRFPSQDWLIVRPWWKYTKTSIKGNMNVLTFSTLNRSLWQACEAVRKTQNNQYYSLQLQGSLLRCADTLWVASKEIPLSGPMLYHSRKLGRVVKLHHASFIAQMGLMMMSLAWSV